MKRMLLCLGLLGAAQAGCVHAGATMYASSEDGVAGGYEQPASAAYGVPASDPKGTVYIVSLGGEQLPVGNGAGLFMHVRIAAENTGDTSPWRFDPNEQTLRLGPGGPPIPASFAEASGPQGGPVLTLEHGQRGQLDLYYPLPAQSSPQRTTLEWRVRRGNEAVANATVFERPAGSDQRRPLYYEPRYDARVHFAIGPGWWWGYDYWPFYYGYYSPFYRPWYGYWGPRTYGYYAPPRYYHGHSARPSGSYYRGSAPAAPRGHVPDGVGRGGFRRR
jgi:hypothetical protein